MLRTSWSDGRSGRRSGMSSRTFARPCAWSLSATISVTCGPAQVWYFLPAPHEDGRGWIGSPTRPSRRAPASVVTSRPPAAAGRRPRPATAGPRATSARTARCRTPRPPGPAARRARALDQSAPDVVDEVRASAAHRGGGPVGLVGPLLATGGVGHPAVPEAPGVLEGVEVPVPRAARVPVGRRPDPVGHVEVAGEGDHVAVADGWPSAVAAPTSSKAGPSIRKCCTPAAEGLDARGVAALRRPDPRGVRRSAASRP